MAGILDWLMSRPIKLSANHKRFDDEQCSSSDGLQVGARTLPMCRFVGLDTIEALAAFFQQYFLAGCIFYKKELLQSLFKLTFSSSP